jgi:hypothetical protein
MTLQLLFWILMIFWAIFIGWGYYEPTRPYVRGGGWLLTFVLFAILGWAIFGAPIKG